MRRAYFRAVARIPEPPRPPLPNGKEYPNDRGNRLHDEAEQYVRGNAELSYELRAFAEDFRALRDIYNDGDAVLEDLWCFDYDWNLVSKTKGKHQWHKHWARIKLDFLGLLSGEHALVIDYKTGKRIGNEIKHNDQVMIYAVSTALLYPKVEKITVELWYLDQNELIQKTLPRERVMRLLPSIERRGLNLTATTDFPAEPSVWNCRFCPYKTGLIGKLGPMGTGDCDKNP